MALVDASQFQLDPRIGQGLAGGIETLGQFQQFGQQNLALQREARVREALSGIGQPQPQQVGQALVGQPQPPLEQPEQAPIPTQAEKIELARQIDPAIANKQLKAMGLDDASKSAEMSRFAAKLESLPIDLRRTEIQKRSQELRNQGRDSSHTDLLLDMDQATQDRALLGVQLMDLTTVQRVTKKAAIERGAEIPAEQRAFENLIEGLSEEDKEKAKKIKLGLKGRAVGSALQTITGTGTAEEVGKTSAIIKQREKFGEMTGASRAKSIDKGFEKIQKIDAGIGTIDRALSALRGGAGTGAIERFLPSMRAASVELENIRNQFALDVIGSVTLGAISESELDLAKQVGLPEGLDEPELINHLEDRKAAQQKLRALYQEQIDFLDNGGTIAGWLRSKKAEQPPASPAPVDASPAPTTQIQFLGFE